MDKALPKKNEKETNRQGQEESMEELRKTNNTINNKNSNNIIINNSNKQEIYLIFNAQSTTEVISGIDR